jgi:hypothetical protein
MRLAKLSIAMAVLCFAIQSQAHAAFTPPNPPAVYGPANFTGASAVLLVKLKTVAYWRCTQSGVVFVAPINATAAQIKLRAGYTCATAKFQLDCGAAMNDPNYAAQAMNWFSLNVNPLWGF